MCWSCTFCQCNTHPSRPNLDVKRFKRYVDDVLKRTSLLPDELLERANKLHHNLSFTLEQPGSGDCIAFLDMEVQLCGNKLECSWYRKPSNTDVILNHNASVYVELGEWYGESNLQLHKYV